MQGVGKFSCLLHVILGGEAEGCVHTAAAEHPASCHT
jgi:hypothetical protein